MTNLFMKVLSTYFLINKILTLDVLKKCGVIKRVCLVGYVILLREAQGAGAVCRFIFVRHT